MIRQGDVFWLEAPDLGRRPVMVVTRTEAAAVLRRVVVAPLTRTVRKLRTEVRFELQPDDVSVASMDNLTTVPVGMLTDYSGASAEGHALCEALKALADCP